jgi:hypothetical protein
MRSTRSITVCMLLVAHACALPCTGDAAVQSPGLAPVERTVNAYIGLYTGEHLAEWKALFLPSFTAAYTNADGTVSARTLDEFYESQRAGFARGPMSEALHAVRITREGRLAHAFAGFDFTSGGNTRRGQLMLLLIESQGQFKIAALTFSYHLP